MEFSFISKSTFFSFITFFFSLLSFFHPTWFFSLPIVGNVHHYHLKLGWFLILVYPLPFLSFHFLSFHLKISVFANGFLLAADYSMDWSLGDFLCPSQMTVYYRSERHYYCTLTIVTFLSLRTVVVIVFIRRT